MSYVIINNFKNTNLANCVLTDGGEVKGAMARKAIQTSVYGSNGGYTAYDGAYDGYERTLTFFVKTAQDALTLIGKFKQTENILEFWYLPNHIYYADMLEASYQPHGTHGWTVEVSLDMYPFRYVKSPADVVMTTAGTIANPGDIYSEPVIIIEGNGAVSLTIGAQRMQLNITQRATIDCRHKRQNIYDKDGRLANTQRTTGPFFELAPGRSGVTYTGNITKITIKGNWRYKV